MPARSRSSPMIAPRQTAAPPPPPQRANPEPRGNPGNWANTNDYPRRALQQEREGTTSFRLTVGPDGRVTDCQITGSSGHDDLDAETCKQMTRRGRFSPKLDGNGNPVSGTWASRVRWEIPK
ncbi:MAG: energy transducer TonB [Sphingomonadales bacterium]|nr:energy transducer TonB [Sphingomonadales bacterium]